MQPAGLLARLSDVIGRLRRRLAGGLFLVAVVPAVGTASDAAVGGGSLGPVTIDSALLARAGAGDASASEVLFADDLVAALAREHRGNLAVSPASIFDALSRLAPGARGHTAAVMATALRSPVSNDALLADVAALDLELNADDALRIASAAWVQDGYGVRDAYSALLAETGSPLQTLDFERDPEGARAVVNGWVAQHTLDRIRTILPPGSLTPLTRLVLANAIALDARWAFPFPEKETRPADFATPGGAHSVPTMHLSGVSLQYGSGDGWEAVRLPYKGGRLDATVVLPDAGVDPLAVLPAVTGPSGRQAFGAAMVNLSLPRFELDTSLDLGAPLAALGLGSLFGRPDLSGIGGRPGELALDVAKHRAWLSVDEGGTKGAAATVFGIALSAKRAQPQVIDFVVDRPFLFIVADHEHGVPLFVARVTDPA